MIYSSPALLSLVSSSPLVFSFLISHFIHFQHVYRHVTFFLHILWLHDNEALDSVLLKCYLLAESLHATVCWGNALVYRRQTDTLAISEWFARWAAPSVNISEMCWTQKANFGKSGWGRVKPNTEAQIHCDFVSSSAVIRCTDAIWLGRARAFSPLLSESSAYRERIERKLILIKVFSFVPPHLYNGFRFWCSGYVRAQIYTFHCCPQTQFTR